MRHSFSFITLFTGLFLGIAISIWSFSEPSDNPPSCTVSTPGCNEPLNAGAARQNKNGGEIGMLNLQLGMQIDGTQAEGSIFKLDEIRGANDLRLYSMGAGNPIYLEGNSVVINNDAGTGNVDIANSRFFVAKIGTGIAGIGTANPGASLEIVAPGGANPTPSQTLRLKKTAGVSGSVDLFVAIGSAGGQTGTAACRAVVPSNATCLEYWDSAGTRVGCGTNRANGRALCIDFGD